MFNVFLSSFWLFHSQKTSHGGSVIKFTVREEFSLRGALLHFKAFEYTVYEKYDYLQVLEIIWYTSVTSR